MTVRGKIVSVVQNEINPSLSNIHAKSIYTVHVTNLSSIEACSDIISLEETGMNIDYWTLMTQN
jgi:hypothetical protein